MAHPDATHEPRHPDEIARRATGVVTTLWRIVDVKRELITLSDHVWRRTWARLDGLTDEEYLWEPVEGSWSIRRRPDGTSMVEWPLPRPDPEPFTTIAWRLCHLIDMYGEDRAPRWLDLPPQGAPIGTDDPDWSPPSTAAEALTLLEHAHDRWDAHLALTDDERLSAAVGPVAGLEYAERSRAAYVLHMLDEFIHHGAEISLLRDLWRWQHTVVDDAVAERIMRGDMSLLDEIDDGGTTSDMVDCAASYARWDLVVGLVERGAPPSTDGRTALHLAAGAGGLAVVRTLLEHGADPNVTDPMFHATPLQWAQFLRHPDVVAELNARAAP
jgi:hypothetical protein